MVIYNNYTCEKGGKYEIWIQKNMIFKNLSHLIWTKVPCGFELGTCGLPNRCVTYWAMKLDNHIDRNKHFHKLFKSPSCDVVL